MTTTSTTTAPHVSTAQDMEALLARWQQTHVGGREQFYRFMSTPGPERDLFIISCRMEVKPEAGANIICLLP